MESYSLIAMEWQGLVSLGLSVITAILVPLIGWALKSSLAEAILRSEKQLCETFDLKLDGLKKDFVQDDVFDAKYETLHRDIEHLSERIDWRQAAARIEQRLEGLGTAQKSQ